MANPAITSIEGVPIDGLKALANTSGMEKVLQLLMGLSEANSGMIQLQVDAAGRPIQDIDGTYRLDASDYMKMNSLNSSVSTQMRSLIEYIPDKRRLSHVKAVEEIFKLHPILRSRSYPLAISADPFQAHTAIARVSTYAGKIADVASMTTMLVEAGAQLNQGDHRGAHNTVASWVAENAGGIAAGRLATLLVAPLMATGPVGMIIGAGIIIGASIGGSDLAKKLYDKLNRRFKDLERMASPLVLDLDGNGIQTLGLTGTGIHFDHDSNGFAEKTAWVGPNDGLLILDLNHNGKVDNGRELFGNHTLLANGKLAKNGFEALAQYDSNKDGRIDRRDPIWGRLRVWRDNNSNGITDAGEWLALEAANTSALLLGYRSSTMIDTNGNAHQELGFYQRADGKLASLTDVWFEKDTIRSRQLHLRPVDARTAALPNLPGIGIIPNLHQALMDPKNGPLRQTFSQ